MIWLERILNLIKDYWYLIVILLIVTIIIVRNYIRGFVWEDRYGNELNLKEFFQRWRKGVEGVTPVQQTLTSLWGYPLIFGGMITGIVINIINKTWWLLFILVGSLPITLMSVVSLWQKYQSQKAAQEAYEEAMSQMEENNNG